MTLFKYGIWAVVMNILTLIVSGYLPWQGYMLIASHLGMAVQGLLYSPYYRIEGKHLVIAAIWTLHNEIIDYVFLCILDTERLINLFPKSATLHFG